MEPREPSFVSVVVAVVVGVLLGSLVLPGCASADDGGEALRSSGFLAELFALATSLVLAVVANLAARRRRARG